MWQSAADMTQDPQSKQSFQTDYHSCLFEEGEKKKTADGEKTFSWLLGVHEMC